ETFKFFEQDCITLRVVSRINWLNKKDQMPVVLCNDIAVVKFKVLIILQVLHSPEDQERNTQWVAHNDLPGTYPCRMNKRSVICFKRLANSYRVSKTIECCVFLFGDKDR